MSYIGNQPVLNTSEFREEFAVTSTQSVFNTGGFTASSDSATLEVLRNGVLLGTADYTLGSDASTVTLANAAVNGDIIVIKGRRELTNGVQVTERRHEHTMGSGETTVTFPYPLTVSQTDVYLNGVKLGSSDFSINSSTRVVSFTTNPAVGDLVAIVSREPALTASSSLSSVLVDANFIGSSSSDTSVSGYKIYAYQTGNGTASYAIKVPSVIDDVDILIVGAGGGTTAYSGGGGGGGVIHLDGITLTPNVYYITVGSGSANSVGGDSIFKTYDGSVVSYTAKGGGNGVSSNTGASGGSGAGGGSADQSRSGGSATQSSQSHSELPFGSITQYGNAGGSNNTGSPYATGGGGGAGAGASGQNAQSASVSGNGGAGIDLSTHFGTALGASGIFAGGGGGMVRAGGTAGSGGTGGGGAGGTGSSTAGTAGTNYTGGGAGGNYESGGNLSGGHGIILIRVPI